jgi:uncharacterized protein (TIGR02757 family)
MMVKLKTVLDEKVAQYNCADFIPDDPISFPHSFTRKEDIEISALLASVIAWGNRKIIVRNAHRMVELMDNAPYDFVVNHTESDLQRLRGFVHRTFNDEDFFAFVTMLRRVYKEFGGIGKIFESEYNTHKDMRVALSNFRKIFFDTDHPARSTKHLSSIDKGATCKRLNMYIRWLVRKDERGVDFGLWDIPSSALYLPLDLHSGNMSRALGLLTRKQNDWRAVEEVTQRLREFDPEDPVKYDFALFGAGIDGFLKQ